MMKNLPLYPWRRQVKIPLPAAVKPQLIRHFSVGLLYPVTEELSASRRRAGLDPVPPTAHQYREAAEDIRTIIRAMGIDLRMGLNMEKMEYKFT